MKKKTRKPSNRTTAPKDIVNVKGALEIVERLDTEFEDGGVGPEASLYRRIYQEALERETRRLTVECRGTDSLALLKLLIGSDAFCMPAEAIRRAGFVQGYEYLRSLLLTGGAV